MSYAQPTDIEAELGRPSSSPAETTQWQAWLDRVERSIERGFRRSSLIFDDQVALDDPTAQDVVDIEVAVVIRKIQNPTWGLTSTTRSIDDASVTDRREGGFLGDPLDLTGDDWSLLLPGTESGAFSTRPGFEPDALPADSWA